MGTSARNAAIYINGTDQSGAFRQFSGDDVIDLEDTTAFGSAVTSKSYTALLKGAKLALAGFWDSTATTGVMAVLHAAIARAAKSVVCLYHGSETTGGNGFAIRADQQSLKRTFPVDGVARVEAEFESSVGIEPVVSLHAKGQETGDGNGTTIDNAAATTAGGAAYLHVFDVGTAVTVTVRHSSDNFSADDTLLASFTVVSSDNASERVAIAGTIKRYVRVVWDLTGNCTFSAALNRR